MAEAVLITTDDLEPAVRLRAAFEAHGLKVELLAPGEGLADALQEPLLVVITGGLRERRARALIASARERTRLPVIGLTEPTEPTGRDICRQLGLSECFPKPIDVEEVALVGRRLIQREELREITGIVGETDAMEEVLERVVQIAPVASTVLILGESGTGKELVARGIHALSPRRHRPFIAVNVAALPETLLESELFGHEKGAFTGASDRRKGFFELANGGTIFLDEIGEMPQSTQTKLLRVLEEREFRRVGGEESIRVDVRVVAATNRDLREQVLNGAFRRDLYHRLNILRIDLPPLRARREDVPRLIDGFIRQFSTQHDRPFVGIEPEALRILVEYDWPGNVRELRNLVESMVVLAPGRVIRPEDIPADVRYGRRGDSLLPVPVSRGRARRTAATREARCPPRRRRSWSSSCARCSTCGWTWRTCGASSRCTAPATAKSCRSERAWARSPSPRPADTRPTRPRPSPWAPRRWRFRRWTSSRSARRARSCSAPARRWPTWSARPSAPRCCTPAATAAALRRCWASASGRCTGSSRSTTSRSERRNGRE